MTSERDWGDINQKLAQFEGQEQALQRLAESGVPVPFINKVKDITPRGVVQQIQAWNAERKARVRIFSEGMEAQVRVWQERIQAGEEVAKTNIRIKLHETMEGLKQQHLHNIQEADRQTVEQSTDMIMEIAQRTAERLYDAQQMDLPQKIKDRLMKAINNKYSSLLGEIEGDIGPKPIKTSDR